MRKELADRLAKGQANERVSKTGPRPLKIDPAELLKWAKAGATQPEIAMKLGMSLPTLERRLKLPEYREILRMGRGELLVSLRARQIQSAMSGNAVMLKWLGEQYLGQAHTHRFVDQQGKDRGLDIASVREYMRNAPEDGEPSSRANR